MVAGEACPSRERAAVPARMVQRVHDEIDEAAQPVGHGLIVFDMVLDAGDTFDDAVRAHGLEGMVSHRERMAVLRRLSACGPLLRGTRVLWVDDQPANNEAEVRLLRSLDVEVQQVTTSTEALDFLKIRNYLLVITDFDRQGSPTAGITFAGQVAAQTAAPPVIGYVGSSQAGMARPAHFFGVTNRPDHLMHLVCDVAQREGS